MDSDDYQSFIDMVARRNLDGPQDPLGHVGRILVVDTTFAGSEPTLHLSAEPYVDDPSSQTRLWPKDVLTNTDNFPGNAGKLDLRKAAVDAVVMDLYDAQMALENPTAPNRNK